MTADTSLTLHRLTIEETRYPLENESRYESSDPRLNALTPLLVRGLQAGANETFFDSPFYEELQYIGDVRIESLCLYALTRDDRLPRKALRLFDASRQPDGFLQSRYPCRVPQVIAPFSLWWVGMLSDYACWRDDPAFVRDRLPGMRATLEGFRRQMGTNGLLQAPEGWNFTDWLPEWDGNAGIPPEGITGYSGVLNWHLVYALALAAGLERALGEPELAAYYTRWGDELSAAALRHFWDEGRGLFADDMAHTSFSEHGQCLAVLSRKLSENQSQRIAAGLSPLSLLCFDSGYSPGQSRLPNGANRAAAGQPEGGQRGTGASQRRQNHPVPAPGTRDAAGDDHAARRRRGCFCMRHDDAALTSERYDPCGLRQGHRIPPVLVSSLRCGQRGDTTHPASRRARVSPSWAYRRGSSGGYPRWNNFAPRISARSRPAISNAALFPGQ